MKSATVLSVEYDKPYTFPNGDVIHYHRLHLSNGDSGNCGVTEMFPAKIAEGATVSYTIENGRIKLVGTAQTQAPTPQKTYVPQPQTPQQKPATKSYGKTPQDAITFILGYASNRHVAKITATKKDVPLQEMLDDADLIYAHYKKMLHD